MNRFGHKRKRVTFQRWKELHCFVPFCSSSSRHYPRISFHSFPLDSVLRAQWVAKIRRSNFTPTKHARVCGRHFHPGNFAVTAAGQRKLLRGSVPVLFQWNDYKAPTVPGLEPRPESPPPDLDCEVDSGEALAAVSDHDYCWTPSVAVRADDLVMENDVLHHTIRELEDQLVQLQHQNRKHFSVERLAGAPDEDVRFYTRFPSFKHFEAFWRLVEPDVNAKMERILGAESASVCSFPQQTLLPIDELLLFLMFLSVGLPPGDLAERFGVHCATASRIIETWAHFLYVVLGSKRLWVPPEVIRAQLPPEFSAFPDTQAVLSCVSVSCQTPAPLPHTEEFPDASKATFKALVAMAPHGTITFVSELYAASMSDRRIFKRCGITQLLAPNMAIMVDKGFLADGKAPCKVYCHAFFSKPSPAEDVGDTRSVSRLKVYVNRTIRRVKENRLFNGDVPLSVCRSINELFSVACFLVNYQNELLVTS